MEKIEEIAEHFADKYWGDCNDSSFDKMKQAIIEALKYMTENEKI